MKRIWNMLLCVLLILSLVCTFSPAYALQTSYTNSKDLHKAHENNSRGVPIYNGQVVTVEGVVTVANGVWHDNANYFTIVTQKNSYRFAGGIAVYLPGKAARYHVGDKVIVTGMLSNTGYASDSGTTVICPASANDTFVNSVYVYDDKLILTYNYKDGSQTLTLQEINATLSSDLTGICPPEKPSRTESEKVFLFTRPIGGAPLNVGQTKQFYAQLKSSDLCSCAYCQNYIRQIRAACPGAAEYLRRMGADIEKPFEVIPLDVDEAGYADYLCAQYILCGDAGDFAEAVVDAVHIRLAEAHPSTRLTQAHFVIELYPIRLKWVMGK